MRLRFPSPGEASGAADLRGASSSPPSGRFAALPCLGVGLLLLAFSVNGKAQDHAGDSISMLQSAPAATPDAPAPQSDSGSGQSQQTKRILGIIPNFRAVSTSDKLPPQSVRDKFVDASEDSFDYSSIFIPAVLAGYSQGTRQYPEFGDGAAAYGRYFWRSALDQTDENYMVEFVFPVLTHEDTRFYTLGHGGFFKRTGYALSRAVITRNDEAHETFNISEIVGAGAASAISSTYYPARERSFGNTGQEWAIDLGIDALSFVGREFWPDIHRKLLHGKG